MSENDDQRKNCFKKKGILDLPIDGSLRDILKYLKAQDGDTGEVWHHDKLKSYLEDIPSILEELWRPLEDGQKRPVINIPWEAEPLLRQIYQQKALEKRGEPASNQNLWNILAEQMTLDDTRQDTRLWKTEEQRQYFNIILQGNESYQYARVWTLCEPQIQERMESIFKLLQLVPTGQMPDAMLECLQHLDYLLLRLTNQIRKGYGEMVECNPKYEKPSMTECLEKASTHVNGLNDTNYAVHQFYTQLLACRNKAACNDGFDFKTDDNSLQTAIELAKRMNAATPDGKRRKNKECHYAEKIYGKWLMRDVRNGQILEDVRTFQKKYGRLRYYLKGKAKQRKRQYALKKIYTLWADKRIAYIERQPHTPGITDWRQFPYRDRFLQLYATLNQSKLDEVVSEVEWLYISAQNMLSNLSNLNNNFFEGQVNDLQRKIEVMLKIMKCDLLQGRAQSCTRFSNEYARRFFTKTGNGNSENSETQCIRIQFLFSKLIMEDGSWRKESPSREEEYHNLLALYRYVLVTLYCYILGGELTRLQWGCSRAEQSRLWLTKQTSPA